MIDQLVPCDRIRPGRKRQRAVVCAAPRMDGDECFLDQIVDLRQIACEAPAEITAELLLQRFEQRR